VKSRERFPFKPRKRGDLGAGREWAGSGREDESQLIRQNINDESCGPYKMRWSESTYFNENANVAINTIKSL
jgi:hypothetical protein